MNIIDVSWFTVSFLIISIVSLVDPKSSIKGTNNNAFVGLFASASSGQQFIYKFSALLIALFIILTLVLSLVG